MSFRVRAGDLESVKQQLNTIVDGNPLLFDIFIIHGDELPSFPRTRSVTLQNVEKAPQSSFVLISEDDSTSDVYNSKKHQLTRLYTQWTKQDENALKISRAKSPIIQDYKQLRVEYRRHLYDLSSVGTQVVLELKSHPFDDPETFSNPQCIYHEDSDFLSSPEAQMMTRKEPVTLSDSIKKDVIKLEPEEYHELYEYSCLACFGSNQTESHNPVDPFFSQYSVPLIVDETSTKALKLSSIEFLLSERLTVLMESNWLVIQFRSLGFHKRWLLFKTSDQSIILWETKSEQESITTKMR